MRRNEDDKSNMDSEMGKQLGRRTSRKLRLHHHSTDVIIRGIRQYQAEAVYLADGSARDRGSRRPLSRCGGHVSPERLDDLAPNAIEPDQGCNFVCKTSVRDGEFVLEETSNRSYENVKGRPSTS